MVDPKKVFVVYGRNTRIRDATFLFLRSVNLEPIEWGEAVRQTGKATPYTLEVIEAGFAIANACVVLFTPDDAVQLSEALASPTDPQYERVQSFQARPNVIFEAGMAMALFPKKTLVVEFGQQRPISDIVGLNTVRMNNSVKCRQDLVERLQTVGCPAQIDGRRDWHDVGDFALEITPQAAPLSDKGSASTKGNADELRQYKIEQLKKFIDRWKNLFFDGPVALSKINSVKMTFNPEVEKFLAKFFDDTYVQRFKEGHGVESLEEFLDELLFQDS